MRTWIAKLPQWQQDCVNNSVNEECILCGEIFEVACKFHGYSPDTDKTPEEVIKILEFADDVEGERNFILNDRSNREELETVSRLTRERWEEVDRTKKQYATRLVELMGYQTSASKMIETLTEERDKAEAVNAKPTALYRQFNASGDLLYIGIALDPFKRLLQHHRGSVWTSEQMTMTTEWHPSRPAALRAEKAAIIDEKPEWNVIHNSVKEAA